MTENIVKNENHDVRASSKITIAKIGQEEYGFPIETLKEVVNTTDITEVPNSPDYILGVVNLRGQVISVVDIKKRFNIVSEEESVVGEHIVVMDVENPPFGILVDKVTEVTDIYVDEIQDVPSTVQSQIGGEFAKGVYVFKGSSQDSSGEERIILILDFTKLLSK